MTDDAIIQLVLAGDTEAYALLVDRHHERCLRIASRILGNKEDAEEAVQDAFLRGFRALAAYEPRERFGAWLTRILINGCRTTSEREMRRSALFEEAEALDQLAGPGAPEDDFPELAAALQLLPLDQREALVLRYADDLTYEEMSRITGAGASALKMRVQRAFARLRALLTEVSHV